MNRVMARCSLNLPQQAPDNEAVAAGADDQRAVDPSVRAGELGPGLGADASPAGADLLELEDQRVAGEAMVAGERQARRGPGLLDGEAGERGALPRRVVPVAGPHGGLDTEHPRQRAGRGVAEVGACHGEQPVPDLLPRRGHRGGMLVDIG
jgi:hypothetical protein